MKKNLIIAFFSVLAFGILIFAGINFVVDPLYFFRWKSGSNYSKIPNIGSHKVRTYFQLTNSKNNYEGLIVGGSKALPLSAEQLKMYTGYNYLRCQTVHGNFPYYYEIIKKALETQNIRHIVLHISGSHELVYDNKKDINDETAYIPKVLTSGNIFADYFHFLFGSISSSLKKIKNFDFESRFTGNVDEYDRDFYKNDILAEYSKKRSLSEIFYKSMVDYELKLPYDYYDSINENGEDAKTDWTNTMLKHYGNENQVFNQVFSGSTGLPLINLDENIFYLKKIKDLCDSNDVKLTVIMGACFIYELNRIEGYQYWDYLRRIADITPYYDFSYICDINMNPYNFYEACHNLNTISFIIFDRIFGNNIYGYGKFVNNSNFDEYIRNRINDFFYYGEMLKKGNLKLQGIDDSSNLSELSNSFLESFSLSAPNLKTNDDFKFAIDNYNGIPFPNDKDFFLQIFEKNKTAHIGGWAFFNGNDTPISRIYVCCGTRVINCEYGYARQDIATGFNNSDLLYTGFSATIPLEYLSGVDKLEFYLIDESGQYISEPYIYNIPTSLPNLPTRNIENPDWHKGMAIDFIGEKNIAKNEEHEIFITEIADYLEIGGWAFDLDNLTNLDSLYINIGSNVLKVSIDNPRTDISNWYSIADTNTFGFSKKIPKNFFYDKSGKLVESIDFYLVAKNKKYMYEPISYKIIKNTN